MPPVGFEPTIPASERLQAHALDCAATGIDGYDIRTKKKQNTNRTVWQQRVNKYAVNVARR